MLYDIINNMRGYDDMNNNLVFKLYKNTIIISELKKEIDYNNLNNTNVIDIKELKFSTEYIRENLELVTNFLNVVIIKKNIVTAQINNMDIALVALDLINGWEHIKKITFKPDKKLNMDIFMKLLDNQYIEEIECYEMANYLIERLDINKNLKVVTRHEIEFKSDFMKDNILDSYSDIYYKKMIIIRKDFDQVELDDFKTFIAINSRLKLIKIIKYSNVLLTSIVDELVKYKKHDIVIEIEEKNNDLDIIYNSVGYIKKTYRRFFEENNITFKLNYSKEYRRNNLFKEINFKTFKAIAVFIILLGIVIVGINYYNQYRDQNSIESQLNEITAILEDAEEERNIDDNEFDIEYIDLGDDTTTTTKKSTYVSAYYTNFTQVFDKLLEKNDDTVGWLEVNNTKINYPVVQGDTNSYYLNRDFYKKKNSMGWVFMDYRNDPVELSKNTIIYGHNIKTGIMFGTLKYMLNSSWYKRPSNQIITFNTPTKNMKWQIFSLYRVPETDDYLKTDFDTDEEYMEFLNMITERSIYDFNIELTAESKIITLSTCNNHVNRNVVHAVLIEEETVE